MPKCFCGNEMTRKDWKHQWVCHKCGRTKPLYESMTNADRIRSMSDEELAKFLNSNCPSCTEFCDEFDGGCMFECRYNRGDDIILKWIKSEVRCE